MPDRHRSRSRSREPPNKRRRDNYYDREEDRRRSRDYYEDRKHVSERRQRHGDDVSQHHASRRERSTDPVHFNGDRRGQHSHDRYNQSSAPEDGIGISALAHEQATNSRRREPLSLEELLKKKAEEKAEAARPVFLTKQARAELALARRAGEAAAYRERTEAMRQGLKSAAGGGTVVESAGAARAQQQRPSQTHRSNDAPFSKERQMELELIKQQYLGVEKPKRKILKASERFKFTFDWEVTDDTSQMNNPFYRDSHEATLLFGRGFRAGIDRREQKKAAAEAETETLRRARAASGVAESAADRRKTADRVDRADRYEGRDMHIEMHWSEKPREAMTERDWRIFREDFNISYRGAAAGTALPIRNWDEAGLPDPVRRAIDRMGYKKPSPIQMASIPLGLQQRDVIGVAETGSGKTAAFVIPMLIYILRQPPMAGHPDIEAEGPYAVVLAPTRELAQQIEEETRALARYTNFRVVSVVGGQSIEDQGFALRKGCEIVVATPGRLVDCVERRYAVLNQCNYVVLDEADRMIDLGFEPQVMGVLDAMPSSNLKPENENEPLEDARVYRTTYMFSATMPPAVERLARKYLRRPVVVNIGTAGKATENVTQRVVWKKENEKPGALAQELEAVGDGARVIVFANTQKKCEQVARAVDALGYASVMLHGGKSQDQREDAIRGFREDRYTVLVATDVAGRGIDVPNVALVINYDMPLTIEAYTHRIGRTGRAGRKGDAMTFLTASDSDVFYDLKKFLEESKASVPRELANHEAAKHKPGAQGGPPKVQYAKK